MCDLFSWRGFLALASMISLIGCSDGYVAPKKCGLDKDCVLGQVCLLERGECDVVPCTPGETQCQAEQRCLVFPSGAAVCSLPECERDAQCEETQVCQEGLCRRKLCMSNEDCPASRVCGAEGSCVAPPAVCRTEADCPAGQGCAPTGKCGARCEQDGQCLFGQVCLLGQSVCGSVPCVGEDGIENCLEGQRCVPIPGGESVCSRPECATSADCTAPALCFQEQCITARCTTRDDCPAGNRCDVSGFCAPPPERCAADNECPRGAVCFPDGSCDPGCVRDSDCADGSYCDVGARICAPGCRDSTECDPGLRCGANRLCACTATSCPDGLVCDLGACVPPPASSCDEVTCQPNFFCNPDDSFKCVFGCTAQTGRYNSCALGTQCNTSSQLCVSSSCGGRDGSECVGTSRPRWNAQGCFCAECLTDAQCPGSEVCDGNGTCRESCARCDANTPGVCGTGANANAPYCVAGCCLECINSADCAVGSTCQAGSCVPGGMCDPNQPTSCPSDQVCDPATRVCKPAAGCGTCNADCTCDGGLVCDGARCVNCTEGADPRCPGPFMLCSGGLCAGF